MMAVVHNNLKRVRRDAFTLAESLFAMTIVAFVLLAMIGVMPAGLDALRESERRAAEARICQTMFADFEGRSWINLGAQSDIITYFDEQGIATQGRTSSRGPTKDPVFAVRSMMIERPEAGEMNMATKGLLPGEESPSPFLRYVRIAIASKLQDPAVINKMQTALRQGRNENSIRIYTFVLASEEPERGWGP
ncbi:MAG: Verru Chthon cassette protein [Verrucomicrobiaceae bacterium]|nr:Verru Chthon cassette protein [Verrucomicrobiaceae bacterium]